MSQRLLGCAVLAAGASRRLGRPKQLQNWGGVTLLNRNLRHALGSGCDELAVVLGAHEPQIRESLGGLERTEITVLVNQEWQEGLAASVRCATRWAEGGGFSALLLVPGDLTHLFSDHLRRLVAAYQDAARLICSRYDGVLGAPALFDRHYFERLQTLVGDRGAASILRSEAQVLSIDFAEGALDLDQPEDLARLPVTE